MRRVARRRLDPDARRIGRLWRREANRVVVRFVRRSAATRHRQYKADKGIRLHRHARILGVPQEHVKANFERYGLLDDQVRFLTGWFKDTLQDAPIDRISVLRLDGDLYESTIQALDALYPRLSPGGFCIVDDYHAIKACAQAVTDYRDKHGVTDEIVEIDGTGVLWRKS